MNILNLAPATAVVSGSSEVNVQQEGLSVSEGISNQSGESNGVATPFKQLLSNEEDVLKQSSAHPQVLDQSEGDVLDLEVDLSLDALPSSAELEEAFVSAAVSGDGLQGNATEFEPVLAIPAMMNQTQTQARFFSSHGGLSLSDVSESSALAPNTMRESAVLLTNQSANLQNLTGIVNSPLNSATNLDETAISLSQAELKSGTHLSSPASEKGMTQTPNINMLSTKGQSQQLGESASQFEAELSNALDMDFAADKASPSSRLVASSVTTGLGTPFESSMINSASPARFSMNVQFGHAEWASDLAAQVSKAAAQNLNFAEIQLDPPELGSLQVRVQVNNDQAQVSFTAQSSQVRDALEQHGNRLREMFSAEGMDLVDVDVRDQNQRESQDELDSETVGTQNDTEDDADSVESKVISARLQAGVDDYV